MSSEYQNHQTNLAHDQKNNSFYSAEHIQLQNEFDTRRMGALMENGMMHTEFSQEEINYIESLDMFLLATLDPKGDPTVSYKGGSPGFVKALDPKTLIFPSYDGNGMFYSMGNIAATARIGLLFLCFDPPNRLRVQGQASILRDHPLQNEYPEAQFLIKVAVSHIFINCARYVHKRLKVEDSKYVPRAGSTTPTPSWKRIDFVQEHLAVKDQGKADSAGGLITFDEYVAKLQAGQS